MRRPNQRIELTTFVLALFAASGLVYNMLAMQIHRDELFGGQGRTDSVGLVLAGFAVFLVFNIVSFGWIVTRHRRSPALSKMATLVLGAMCMVLMVVEKVMIDEIGREYRLGWELRGEWVILYTSMTIQLAYGLIVLMHVFHEHRSRRLEGSDSRVPSDLPDENVFVVAQVMGIISGSIGLWMNFSFINRQVHSDNLLFLLPFYVVAILPYGIAGVYWIVMRLGERLADWYDEKQWRNMASAGLVTMVLSIPGMACLLFVSQPLNMLWFPHYLFLTTLLFSGTTLILFRHAA